ncbi:MAG: SAM-dependent methyltransferase [Anaerolineae bacterium]
MVPDGGQSGPLMVEVVVSHSPGFDDLVLNEITRTHAQAAHTGSPAPGVMLVSVPGSFNAFARPWQDALPIYLHHIFPAQVCLRLAGTPDDLRLLQDAFRADLAPLIRPGLPLGIQPRLVADAHGRAVPDAPPAPQDLPYTADGVRRALARAANQRITQPGEQILCVVIAEAQEGLTAHMGVSLAAQNISAWAGGAVPYRQAVPSRAAYKLYEAVDAFGPYGLALEPGRQALDLGAAPGGWTRVLPEHGLTGTAVDAAEMDPAVAADPGVAHIQLPAEVYVERVRGPYDVITNDIIIDAQDSARLMVDYADALRQGATGVMTLKLRAHNRRRVMDHSFRLLRKAYHIVRVRQLYYNRSEVTLLLRRS